MAKYVTYIRVSTTKQGESGLGLQAQQAALDTYLKANVGEVIAEFSEVASGGKDDRVVLAKALRECRLKGAVLLIAKLDRLSRSMRFLLELQDSNVDFVCCDMPEANRLTIGLMASIADYERQLTSERTKAALAAAKERGVKLGNPRLSEFRNLNPVEAREARVKKANAYKTEMLEVIREMEMEAGGPLSSLRLASMLNEAGYQTPRGSKWTHTQVLRVKAAA